MYRTLAPPPGKIARGALVFLPLFCGVAAGKRTLFVGFLYAEARGLHAPVTAECPVPLHRPNEDGRAKKYFKNTAMPPGSREKRENGRGRAGFPLCGEMIITLT